MKRKLFYYTLVCCMFLFSKLALAQTYYYYLPYYTSLNGYGTGVALKNCDATTIDAVALVDVYDSNGNLLATETKSIPSFGQTAFIAGGGLNKEGWMMVSSTSPLAGLCFFGAGGSKNYIADISLISELSLILVVPHVAQNATWDTTIMVCNPHSTGTWVTLSYVDATGVTLYSEDCSIQAYGSLQCDMSELVQGASCANGSVEIYAERGVAAFALYKNTKTGAYSYAGISAVDPLVVTENITIETLAGDYELTGFVHIFEDGYVLTQNDLSFFSGDMAISQDGAVGQNFNFEGNTSTSTIMITVINNNIFLVESEGGYGFIEFVYKNEILILSFEAEADGIRATVSQIWQKTDSRFLSQMRKYQADETSPIDAVIGSLGAVIGRQINK